MKKKNESVQQKCCFVLGKKLSKEFAGQSKTITLQQLPQAKQTRTKLKKKIISWTPRREERFSTRPEILMTRIRVINFIEVQLLI